MKKKLKRVLLIFIVIFAVSYYFDINLREVLSSAQTFVLDNLDKAFPGAKGQFDNINTQISSVIVKNSTAKSIQSKTLKAKKNASIFINRSWLNVKRFALKKGVNIDDMFLWFRRTFKYKNRATKKTNASTSSNYSFDYKNMSIQDLSSLRQNFINYSLTLRGIPYMLGSENPSVGFDCSSFVRYSAKNGINVELPRTAQRQYNSVLKISASEREPGDLLFFRSYGKISHVGIYLGRYEGEGDFYGKEIFINAASEGPHTGVTISALDAPYWKKHYSSCGRFIPSSKEIVEAIVINGQESVKSVE